MRDRENKDRKEGDLGGGERGRTEYHRGYSTVGAVAPMVSRSNRHT